LTDFFNSGPQTIDEINSFLSPGAGSTPKVSLFIDAEHLLVPTQFFKFVFSLF
jgi:hypothetical protein